METIVIIIIIFIIICCCGCIFMYSQNNSAISSQITTVPKLNQDTSAISSQDTSAILSQDTSAISSQITTVPKLNQDTSLILFYKFDVNDIQNDNVMNYATGKYDAILKSGASIQSSDYKVGNGSLLLDGSKSQYLQLPNITPGNNGLTIAYWFKTNNSIGWSRLFDFGNGGANNNWLQSPINGLSVYNGNAPVLQPNVSPMEFANNTWYHSVWTLTPAPNASATSTWNYYINGVLIKTHSNGGYPQPITLTTNYIGKSNWDVDPYYNGAIDDFRLYNRVLSDSEVTSLYNY